MMTIARSMKPVFATLLFVGAVAIAAGSMASLAGAAEPAGQGKPSAGTTPGASTATKPASKKPAARQAAKPLPIPQSCATMKGVERKICVECEGVAFFKKIGCQQRVFWTTCKGKRLFEDSYCQSHQDQGPPRGRGEGG